MSAKKTISAALTGAMVIAARCPDASAADASPVSDATMPADASRILDRGKLQRCIDCHVEYRDRDLVTKNYVLGFPQ